MSQNWKLKRDFLDYLLFLPARTLRELYFQEGITPSQLRKQIKQSFSATYLVLDLLEQKGLAYKKGDYRFTIHLTDKGRKVGQLLARLTN